MPRQFYDETNGVVEMEEAQDRASLRAYRAAYAYSPEDASALAHFVCGDDFAGSTALTDRRAARGNHQEPVSGEIEVPDA